MIITKLTKKDICKQFTEEVIISTVLNIPLSEIRTCLNDRKYKIKNPLRVDNNPSLGMIYKSRTDGIHLHDFAEPLYRGDIFDFIGIIYGLNAYNNGEFKKILLKTLLIMNKNEEKQNLNILKNKTLNKTLSKIEFNIREFSSEDKAYWLNGFITNKDLIDRNAFPISSATYNSEDVPIVRNFQPSYAYVFPYDKKNHYIELYSPFAGKGYKFKTNTQKLKISPKLNKTKNLILIKSYKDLIVLEKIVEVYKLDFTVIAMPSESYILDEQTVSSLKSKFDKIFMFADYDRQGIVTMFLHNIIFDFEPICYVNPNKEIDISDIDIRAIINKCKLYNSSVNPQDVFDFISLLLQLNIESNHKDLYDNIKANKKNLKIIINHLKTVL